MDFFDDFFGPLNIIDHLEGFIRGVAYGDVLPHRIALPHPECDWWENNPGAPFWNLTGMRAVLHTYHVYTYQIGFDDREIWCHVPNKQARWAEYVLLRAGCPFQSDTVDSRNVAWASNPAHGGLMPARWDDREREFTEQEGRGS